MAIFLRIRQHPVFWCDGQSTITCVRTSMIYMNTCMCAWILYMYVHMCLGSMGRAPLPMQKHKCIYEYMNICLSCIHVCMCVFGRDGQSTITYVTTYVYALFFFDLLKLLFSLCLGVMGRAPLPRYWHMYVCVCVCVCVCVFVCMYIYICIYVCV